MASEWSERPLAELTDNFDGIRVPVREADRRPGPYPYYGASGVVDHVDNFLFDGEYLLIAEDGENLRTRNTPVAFLARGKFWVNNHAHIVRGNGEADTRFLMYALAATDISGYLTGSTMPKLTQGNLNRIPLRTPPLHEQRAIAHILGTLDDKIELNRQMNETLEATARMLFKSWFVDFDPVRAKAEGRDPGLPKRLADLFPDSLEDSELGEIPRGWGVAPLGDLVCYLNRGIGPVYVDAEGICVLNQKCIRGRRVEFSEARRHDFTKRSIEGRTLRVLDILVNSTGVGTLGRVAQLWELPEEAIVDSHVTVVRAGANVDPWFLGIMLLGREAEIEALGEGSTGQTELSRARIAGMRCLFPDRVVQHSFGEQVAPMLARLTESVRESRTLGALRGTLLRKLVSGELRVKEVERIAGISV